jgi:quercetin dioxygenase-like cupin family protein
MMNPPDSDSDDTLATLDDDIVRALADAQAWEAPPAVATARVKHRLLQRVAQAQTRHLTVPAAQGTWQPFQPGVEIKVLHEADGIMSYLLRLAPGAALAAHRHPIDEECVVLEGRVRIGDTLEIGTGAFHLARRDALHAPISTVDGAMIFLRGASPHPGHLV